MAKKEYLTRIADQIKRCQQCRLYRTRNKTVSGQGSLSPRVVFIGEAPGANEDEKGIPFCGRAGRLLDQLLAGIRLKRDDVWIGNILKCRPPDNRNPMVDEVRACRPYLDEQLKLLNPELIVTLGRFATDHFIKDARISKEHGEPKKSGSYVIYPVYHPAAALRSRQVLMILKSDFQKIPKILSGQVEAVEVGVEKENEDQISLF